MKLLLAILCLAALVVGFVLAMRRGSGDVGYRRRFDNRYRHDRGADGERTDATTYTPLFIAGAADHASHSHAHGHADCGVSVGHSDGGAGCDGGN